MRASISYRERLHDELLGDQVPAHRYGYMDFDKAPVAYEDKVQDKLVCAFVSNCRPKNARTQILQELVAQLEGQIDSFGRCHGNADFRETLKAMGKWEQAGGEGASWWNIKTTTCAQYKFTVAFENSNEIDYVTEKVRPSEPDHRREPADVQCHPLCTVLPGR